jgi:hypothetical protein
MPERDAEGMSKTLCQLGVRHVAIIDLDELSAPIVRSAA